MTNSVVFNRWENRNKNTNCILTFYFIFTSKVKVSGWSGEKERIAQSIFLYCKAQENLWEITTDFLWLKKAKVKWWLPKFWICCLLFPSKAHLIATWLIRCWFNTSWDARSWCLCFPEDKNTFFKALGCQPHCSETYAVLLLQITNGFSFVQWFSHTNNLFCLLRLLKWVRSLQIGINCIVFTG